MYSPTSSGLSSFDSPLVDYHSNQCLKYKYFTTFLICTTSLALLSASLATHNWIVSKPFKVLKIKGGQTNYSSLFSNQNLYSNQHTITTNNNNLHTQQTTLPQQLIATTLLVNNPDIDQKFTQPIDNKHQGKIHFGLFSGVKVLNHGFGERTSQISGEL